MKRTLLLSGNETQEELKQTLAFSSTSKGFDGFFAALEQAKIKAAAQQSAKQQ